MAAAQRREAQRKQLLDLKRKNKKAVIGNEQVDADIVISTKQNGNGFTDSTTELFVNESPSS